MSLIYLLRSWEIHNSLSEKSYKENPSKQNKWNFIELSGVSDMILWPPERHQFHIFGSFIGLLNEFHQFIKL